jgi:hypothetical protein
MQKAAEGAAGVDPGKLDHCDRLKCEDSKSQRPTCDLGAEHENMKGNALVLSTSMTMSVLLDQLNM